MNKINFTNIKKGIVYLNSFLIFISSLSFSRICLHLPLSFSLTLNGTLKIQSNSKPLIGLGFLCNASEPLDSTMEPSIYGHSHPLNITAESDDGSGPDNTIEGHHHIQYETHGLNDGGVGGGVVVDEGTSDAVYGHGGGNSELALQSFDDSSQLTLSFRGQVYVFDSVTPDKARFSIVD